MSCERARFSGSPSGRESDCSEVRRAGSCDAHGVSDLIELRDRMREFTAERDWGRFHDPKSLILALVGEVGELAELFQWLPANEAERRAAAEPLRTRVGEELADVLIYLVRLADVLDIDLASMAQEKLKAGEARYPAAAHYGQAPAKGLDRGSAQSH